MTMTKNKMVREIGRRTRLKNREVQAMLESLIYIWTEELINGERIELENFLVIQVQRINRGENAGHLIVHGDTYFAPQEVSRLIVRPSKYLRARLKRFS